MNDDKIEGPGMSQGLYFAVTGLWPLLHMRSFEAVTGRKTDKWLVKTVGILVAVIGGTVASAASRRQMTAETIGLAIGAAAGLAAIDILYVCKRTIAPIYLADALIEAAFISRW